MNVRHSATEVQLILNSGSLMCYIIMAKLSFPPPNQLITWLLRYTSSAKFPGPVHIIHARSRSQLNTDNVSSASGDVGRRCRTCLRRTMLHHPALVYYPSMRSSNQSRIMNPSCTFARPASPISTSPSQLPNSDTPQETMERRDTTSLHHHPAEVLSQ